MSVGVLREYIGALTTV